MRLAGIALVTLLCGCGQKGTVTFTVDAPADPRLSPFADPRRDTVVLYDQNNMALGTVGTGSQPGTALDLGDVPVGHYGEIRMKLSGGGQLLGLAKTRNVDVLAEMNIPVSLHARKPLATYGTTGFVYSDPTLRNKPQEGEFSPFSPLMLLDTTLPAGQPPPVTVVPQSRFTVSTHDGLYVLSVSDAQVTEIDSGTLYNAPGVANSASLQKAAGSSAKPVPRGIYVSADDTLALVVSDQGVSWFVPGAMALSGGELPTLKLPNARAAAWSSDGRIAVLLGPSWQMIDCTAKQPVAQFAYLQLTDGALAQTGGLLMAPPGATDIAFDTSGNEIFAVPCGAGITDASGNAIVSGKGIYDVVVADTKLIGLTGTIKQLKTFPYDDSGLRGTMIINAGGTTNTSLDFSIPSDSITVETTMPTPPTPPTLNLVRVLPASLTVYSAAASPDGSTMTFLQRVRYQTFKDGGAAGPTTFLQLVDDKQAVVFYCTLNVTRDIYRLTQLDSVSGAIGFQSTVGVNDKKCERQCFDCLNGPCIAGKTEPICQVNDGFIPEGLTVMLGSR